MNKWNDAVQLAIKRVKAVGQGGTINGAYKMSPDESLPLFRADLLILVAYTEAMTNDTHGS